MTWAVAVSAALVAVVAVEVPTLIAVAAGWWIFALVDRQRASSYQQEIPRYRHPPSRYGLLPEVAIYVVAGWDAVVVVVAEPALAVDRVAASGQEWDAETPMDEQHVPRALFRAPPTAASVLLLLFSNILYNRSAYSGPNPQTPFLASDNDCR